MTGNVANWSLKEMMLKELAKRLLKRCGYEMLGHGRAFGVQRSLIGLIRQKDINIILDVGANTGQFASELRALGYAGKIISFEPLAVAHAQLCKQAEADANWTISPRTALGSSAGSVDVNVSANSVSSSILEMLPSHSDAEPRSGYVGVETVPLNRLDDLYSVAPTDRVLLKIDVQGYEKQVLEGASGILGCCRGVIAEMSLVPLYGGQALAREIWDLLAERGFEAWSLEPGFRHPESGRMFQLDAFFVRRTEEPQA